MKNFWHKKIKEPILALLKLGLTPKELARALSLGAIIGIIPLLGVTVILCALLAKIFRLNQVAIQITNYAVYPLQFLLLIPFFRMGETLFGAPHIPLDITQMLKLLSENPKLFFAQFSLTAVHGLSAWIICSLILFPLLTLIFSLILAKAMKKPL